MCDLEQLARLGRRRRLPAQAPGEIDGGLDQIAVALRNAAVGKAAAAFEADAGAVKVIGDTERL